MGLLDRLSAGANEYCTVYIDTIEQNFEVHFRIRVSKIWIIYKIENKVDVMPNTFYK